MLEIALVIGSLAIIIWIVYSIVVVIKGNNYHRMVREAVIAECGVSALAFLTSKPIVEMITISYRQGQPPATVAFTLSMLIQRELQKAEHEHADEV